MSRFGRVPLYLVLAVVLVATGILASTATSVNPSQLPGALALNGSAESTALYCTGFSSTAVGEAGRVIFLNTTGHSHRVTFNVVSDTGYKLSHTMTLRAYQQYGFNPNATLQGNYFGVGAQVSGGGVVGVVVARGATSEAPCISTGITNWYGAGFDTLVGSSAVLSVYNPTATPAVFNVSTFSSAGYDAPTKFQGYAVGPHDQAEINLGTEIVDLSNIGVHVRVLRGALDIVGIQKSGPIISLNTGTTATMTSATFPLVTTANNATAAIRLSNPGATPATVTLHVTLAPFHVAPQSVSVPPHGSAVATITPNPAIPAAGYASVRMSSNVAVFAALATGTGAPISLSAPQSAQSEYLVGDFTGHGFDAASVTNTSARTLTISVTTLPNSRSAKLTKALFHLNADTTVSLRTAFPTLTTLHGVVLLVRTSRASSLVTLTLPTTPAGMGVVSALDGR